MKSIRNVYIYIYIFLFSPLYIPLKGPIGGVFSPSTVYKAILGVQSAEQILKDQLRKWMSLQLDQSPDLSPELSSWWHIHPFLFNKNCLHEKLDLTTFSLEKIGAKKLGSDAFVTGPGRYWYRKVDAKQRNNSVELAGRNSATLQSYDKKTK